MKHQPKKKRNYGPKPNYPTTERGRKWLEEMIKASQAADAGKKNTVNDVLDEMQTPLLRGVGPRCQRNTEKANGINDRSQENIDAPVHKARCQRGRHTRQNLHPPVQGM